MAMCGSDNVKYHNCVSVILGFCKGLGFVTDELQEPLVKKRIGSSSEVHLLLLHGMYAYKS